MTLAARPQDTRLKSTRNPNRRLRRESPESLRATEADWRTKQINRRGTKVAQALMMQHHRGEGGHAPWHNFAEW